MSDYKVRFVDFPKQYKKYQDEIDAAIVSCLRRGALILQEDVERFEAELAAFVGTKYAVGLNSGTDALYLALWAHGISTGDEVLVPSHTFVATAQVVNQLGATPVLYDRDVQYVSKITEKTKAIIPAHIAGAFSMDMENLRETMFARGIIVIEDSCQALGAVQSGKMAGSWGHAGAFSFYPAKILGCFGDGGALVTNSEEIYNKVKSLRNHCKDNPGEWGINSRLDNIQAAVLRVRLSHLPEMLFHRAHIAGIYLKELEGVVGLPVNTEGRVWQDFIIQTEKRDELHEFLSAQGIETLKNEYPMPIGKLPEAVKYEAETLRIPCNDVLEDEEAMHVVEKIKEFFKND